MNTLTDLLDKLASKWLIYSLSKGYNRCHDYEDRCPSCKAYEAIRFMKNHVALIDWE